MTLEEESARATQLLRGLTVRRIVRHREREVLIEFDDGSRLFTDSKAALHLSIHHTDD